MYILYIYPRVRAVGFSMGLSTPNRGSPDPYYGVDNGPMIRALRGVYM